jgi:transposase
VIHASSVAVSREHRRAKTDRLDTELLKRAFVGWLRGERDHCKTAAIPSLREEDAKRPSRERESLVGGTNREKGMARSGNARVRRGMIQLAWRFLLFQKDSALAQWYRQRTGIHRKPARP